MKTSIEHIVAGLTPWLEHWRALLTSQPLSVEARATLQERVYLFQNTITALREKHTYKQGYSDGWTGHWLAVSNAKMQMWVWGDNGPTDKNFDPGAASRLPDDQIGYLIAAAVRDADVLREAIAEAPHDIEKCDYLATREAEKPLPCNCWKSRVPESHVKTLTGQK